jgi:site-specific DNA recombinase
MNRENATLETNYIQVELLGVNLVQWHLTYTGDFIWGGKFYKGKHEPLVNRDDFERVQAILTNKCKGQKTKRDFKFSGLLSCSGCGRTITAEIKKEKYVYYHCANPSCELRTKNVREEVIDEQVVTFLGLLQVPEDIRQLTIATLKDAHGEEKLFHEQSVSTIQAEICKVQRRMEKIYEDKLDGVIDETFWARKHQEYVQEKERLMNAHEQHNRGTADYLETGVQIVELTEKALPLYKRVPNLEKRRLLRFLASNFAWDGKTLSPDWNPAFDFIIKNREFKNWRSGGDSNSRWAQHPHSLSRTSFCSRKSCTSVYSTTSCNSGFAIRCHTFVPDGILTAVYQAS